MLTKWWEQLLHNQSALVLKGRLLFRRNTVVVSVPYHIDGGDGRAAGGDGGAAGAGDGAVVSIVVLLLLAVALLLLSLRMETRAAAIDRRRATVRALRRLRRAVGADPLPKPLST